MYLKNTWGRPATDEMLDRIREETVRDHQLSGLMQVLQSEWPPSKRHLPEELRIFWDNRHLFTQIDGIILRGQQIVIPKALRPRMITNAHEGHLGIVKTKTRAREVIWWPGMSSHLEQAVLGCEACARFQHQQLKEPLISSTLPQRPWEQVATDIFTWDSQHYLLTVDYYSRFPEIQRLPSLKSAAVIDSLKDVFSRNGIPNQLRSDNGPQFANAEFQQFASTYGFQHTTSSPRYPQSNGLVERMVQTIKNIIKKTTASKGDVNLALLAYRTTPHEATGVSPAQLLMGRKLRTTLPSLPTYLQPELVTRDCQSKSTQESDYNRRRAVRSLPELRPGDHVLVWDANHKEWKKQGRVQMKVKERSYRVILQSGGIIRRNRHQLKFRRHSIPGSQLHSEAGDLEEDTEEPGCIQVQGYHEPTAAGCETTPHTGMTTRSGRVVRPPAWRQDYV